MGTIVEIRHDSNGIIWSESIAPFLVHLVGLNLDDKKVAKRAGEVYEKLLLENIEVLYDDRIEASAGQKFADADLIGVPYRVVVSAKTGDKVEVKKRSDGNVKLMGFEGLVAHLV